MLGVAIVFILGTAGYLSNEWLSTILIQIVIVAGIPIIMYSLIFKKNLKNTFSDFGFKKMSAKMILLSFAVGITLYLLNIFVADSFATVIVLFGYETNITSLSINYSSMLTDFLLTACLPGLCEEILHRGLMLNCCKKEGYTRYGLICSSILFGLLHLNILQFFYATILGFCMGLAVLRTESIWTGVICHFTNNFLSVYFSYDTGLPLQRFYNYIFDKIINLSPILLIGFCSGAMLGLVYLFKWLLSLIDKQRTKEKVATLTKELNNQNLDETEYESKIAEINQLLQKDNNKTKTITNKQKTALADNLFLICSLVLGSVATIFTFVIGII